MYLADSFDRILCPIQAIAAMRIARRRGVRVRATSGSRNKVTMETTKTNESRMSVAATWRNLPKVGQIVEIMF
jgi:hypothetical protein